MITHLLYIKQSSASFTSELATHVEGSGTIPVESATAFLVYHFPIIEVSQAGVHVDIEQPFIGVSPDRLLNCACCGRRSSVHYV